MSGRATSSQHPGERLVGLVQIRQDRVKPEPGAVVHRRAFLLGMRVDQRRVDIDHDPLGPNPETPRTFPRRRTRGAQRIKQRRLAGDPIDQPKRRRVRSDRPEQRLLIPDRAKVRQTVAAVGEHHREIPDHPAGIMTSTTLTNPRQRTRELPGETDPVSDLAEQRGTRMRNQALSVRRDIYREIAPIALHLQGEPPEQILRRRTPTESLLRRTVPRPRPSGPQLLHARSGCPGSATANAGGRTARPPAA